MTTPSLTQIHKFLLKGLALSRKVDQEQTHLDAWFYQNMMSEFDLALGSSSNIIYTTADKLNTFDLNELEHTVIIYDSGDAPKTIPGDNRVCIFKRMICLVAKKAISHGFDANCSFMLGTDVNRHTVASFKERTTHFLLPFDINLYVEQSMLDEHGAEALETNLFNQDGYLFSPHITPSVVTGLLTHGNLIDIAAFVAQPKILRMLAIDLDIKIDKQATNEDLNGDVLLALKILGNRYKLPINPEIYKKVNDFDRQLQADSQEISVNIANTDVTIIKTPKH